MLALAILNAAFRQMAVGTSAISQRYTPSELSTVIARGSSGERVLGEGEDTANEQGDHIEHVMPRSPWHSATPPRWVNTSIIALAAYQIAEHLDQADSLEATARMISGASANTLPPLTAQLALFSPSRGLPRARRRFCRDRSGSGAGRALVRAHVPVRCCAVALTLTR